MVNGLPDEYGKELADVRATWHSYIEVCLQTGPTLCVEGLHRGDHSHSDRRGPGCAHGPGGGLSVDDLWPDDIELARRDEPDTARSLVPGLEKAAAGLGLSRSYTVKAVKSPRPDEARTGRTRWAFLVVLRPTGDVADAAAVTMLAALAARLGERGRGG